MAHSPRATTEYATIEKVLLRAQRVRPPHTPHDGLDADLSAQLQLVVTTAVEALGCEAASVLLFDEATGALRCAAATDGHPEHPDAAKVSLDADLAGIIYTQNRTLIINDAAEHDLEAAAASSWLGVPMGVDGQPVGVLEALNKRRGPFTADDASVLTALGAQAALALGNVRHVLELRAANAHLNELLHLTSDFMTLASRELRPSLSTVERQGLALKQEQPPELGPLADTLLATSSRLERVVEAMGQLQALHAAPRA